MRAKVVTVMRWYAQDEVNQEESEQNEVDGIMGADSTGEVKHMWKSGWWFLMRKIRVVVAHLADTRKDPWKERQMFWHVRNLITSVHGITDRFFRKWIVIIFWYCLVCVSVANPSKQFSINSEKVIVASEVFSVQLKQEIIILSKESPAGQPGFTPNACELDASSASVEKCLVAAESIPLPCRLVEVAEILDITPVSFSHMPCCRCTQCT